jgi:BirA family biotin operon repressor/biotin-[acetyl-CoA-carboxylase] ligase
LSAGDALPQTLSLAAGLALIEALDAAAPAQPLMLKWPNDVMLLGKKLAGILLERSGDRIAVGFGVNLTTAPSLSGREASVLPGSVTPQTFAPLLAGGFARMLSLWRSTEPSALVRAWQERAHLPGTRLTVHSGKDELINGRFAGLEHDGALRLMVDDGSIEIVRAGDISVEK